MVAGDIEAITMDAVAERAGVSRPLVYKHFANRHELLAAVYTRESALLHAELEAAVTAATSFEGMVRALIRGALDAQAKRGAAFASLGAAGLRTTDRRRSNATGIAPRWRSSPAAPSESSVSTAVRLAPGSGSCLERSPRC